MFADTNLSRRAFLGGMVGVSAGLAMGAEAVRPITFMLCSDIHPEFVDDGLERIAALTQAAKDNAVDFVVNMGDFTRATAGATFTKYHKPWIEGLGGIKHYYVLGNHDLDGGGGSAADKAAIVKAWGMPGRYYAFDVGAWRLFAIDGHFTNRRFGVDAEQLAWLRAELAAMGKRCLLFSHESFERDFKGHRAMENGAEVRAILEEANQKAGFRKVVAAFSGHDHTNYDKAINGIRYIQINSTTYTWINGTKDASGKVKNKFLYDGVPYGIVSLYPDRLVMKGVQCKYRSPTPAECGCGPIYDGIGYDGTYPNGCPFTASNNDVLIRL